MKKEFYPKISKRTTEELILIANSTTKQWQKEAIQQAIEELQKRNISEQEQDDFLSKKIQLIDKYYADLELKKSTNALEKYKFHEIVFIILLAPFLIGRWSVFYNLKSQNYLIKYKQRIILILIGMILWFGYVYYSFNDWNNKQHHTESVTYITNNHTYKLLFLTKNQQSHKGNESV